MRALCQETIIMSQTTFHLPDIKYIHSIITIRHHNLWCDSHNACDTRSYIGGEMEGQRGLEPLHFERAEPPHFLSVYPFQNTLCNKKEASKPLQKASETLSENWKFQIFLWEHTPRPPRWLLVLVFEAWAPSFLQSILCPWVNQVMWVKSLYYIGSN